MSLVCFVNSLLSATVSAMQKRGLAALVAIALVMSAHVVFAQGSSPTHEPAPAAVVEQQTEVITSEPAATVNQAAPAQTIANQTLPNQTTSNQTLSNQTTAQQNNPAPIGSGRHLVSVTLALMGIVGLIFALSWFVKRFSHGGFTAGSTIKILSSMPLGARERIVLIDAGGQQLLLGITATNINTLHVFETPIVVDNKTENQSDFSRKLMTILQQKTPLMSMQDSNNKNNSAP